MVRRRNSHWICHKWGPHAKLAQQIIDWKHALSDNWDKLKFNDLQIETNNGQHFFKTYVSLGNLNPHDVKVELYSNALTIEMENQGETPNGYIYKINVPSTHPASYFTPRIIPRFSGVAIPLESNHILWHK